MRDGEERDAGKRHPLQPWTRVEGEVEDEVTRLMRGERHCRTGKKLHKVGGTATTRLSWRLLLLLGGEQYGAQNDEERRDRAAERRGTSVAVLRSRRLEA